MIIDSNIQKYHMEYKETMKSQSSNQLNNFYTMFLKDNLSQKMQSTNNCQVLADIIEKIIENSKEQFLGNVSREIEKVKCQNKQLKQKNEDTIKQYQQKILALSAKIKRQCQANLQAQAQQLIKMKNRLIEILGQQQIIFAVRNIKSQSKVLQDSLTYREEYIEKLQCELKDMKNKEIQLARQLQHCESELKNTIIVKDQDKQTHIKQKQSLDNQVKNLHNQLKQKIQELSIKEQKLNQKEKQLLKFQDNVQVLSSLVSQQKQEIQNFKNRITHMQKLIKKTNEEKENLINNNKQLEYRLNTLSNQNNALEIDKVKKQQLNKLLKVNLQTCIDRNKIEREQLEDRSRKQYIRTQMLIKELRQQNQYLRNKMEDLFSKKEQLEDLLLKMKEKYEYQIDKISKFHKKEINQKEKQQQKDLLIFKEQIQKLADQLNSIKNNQKVIEQLKENLVKSQSEIVQLKTTIQNIQNQRRFFFRRVSSSNFSPTNQQQRYVTLLMLSHKKIQNLKQQLFDLKCQFQTQMLNNNQMLKKQFLLVIKKVMKWKTKCLLCQHKNITSNSESVCYSFRDNLETFYNGKATKNTSYKQISKKTIKKSLQNLNSKYAHLQGQTNTFKKYLECTMQTSFNS